MSTQLVHKRIHLFGSEPYVLTRYHKDKLPHKKTSECDPNTCTDLTRWQAIAYFQTVFTTFPLTDYAMDTIRLCKNLAEPSVPQTVEIDWTTTFIHTDPPHYDPWHEVGKMIGGLLNVVNSQLPSNHNNKLAKEHLNRVERALDGLTQWRLRQR